MIPMNPWNVLGHLGAAKAMWGGLSRITRRTIAGAGVGALYGAWSDNTSVVGGAMMGAGLARYGGAAGRYALKVGIRRGDPRMLPMTGHPFMIGARSARLAMMTARRDASRAGRLIGRTGGMAFNHIRGLFR